MTIQINKGDRIAGRPAKQVRDIVCRIGPRNCSVRVDFFADTLKTDIVDATAFAEELVRLGYLERNLDLEKHEDKDKRWYSNTELGVKLAQASAAKRITRATAERILCEFLERVHIANRRDDFIYSVKTVVLFGSYLSESESLGDIDLGIELEPKFTPDSSAKARERHIHQAEEKGKRFSNIVDRLCWPQAEVLTFLKARSRALRFQEFVMLAELAEKQPFKYQVLIGDVEKVRTQLGKDIVEGFKTSL